MTSSECSKFCLLSTAILFAVLWGYDFVVHGHLLVSEYDTIKGLWRPMAEIQALGGWCIAGTAAAAFVFTCIYNCWSAKCTDHGGCKINAGLTFGLWVGLLIGILQAKSYVWLPIPGKLAVLWLVADVAKWGIAGAVLAKISSWKKA